MEGVTFCRQLEEQLSVLALGQELVQRLGVSFGEEVSLVGEATNGIAATFYQRLQMRNQGG